MKKGFDLRAALACGAAALLAGAVYLNALHNPFVYDDYRTVVQNPSLTKFSDLRAIALHDIKRPVLNVSYAIDRTLTGPTSFGFHVTNVVLHMAAVMLLFVLARGLADGRHGELVGFSAAALFAVHPMMTEAVGYVSGRSEVLCAVFFLSATLCGLRWLRDEGFRWRVLTAVFWLMAMASKETAMMFPFVLLAADWFTLPREPEEVRRRFKRVHAPLLVIAGVLGALRLFVLLTIEHAGEAASVHPAYLLLALHVAARYVALVAVPTKLTIFHEVSAVNSIVDPRAVTAIAVIGAMIASAIKLRAHQPAAGFGIVWFLLLLLPSSALTVLDKGEPMADHRVYLASAGLFLAVGIAVRFVADRLATLRFERVSAGIAFALVLAAFSAETMLRNLVWSDPVRLWSEAVTLAPNHYRPRLLLGEALQDAGRREEAAAQFTTATRLRPADPVAHLKLGMCLAELGRFDQARLSFQQALQLDPRNEPARRSLQLLNAIAPAR